MAICDIELVKTYLNQALHPTALTIIDESHLHIGHEGAKQGAHIAVHIASPAFKDKSLVECHRMIYAALGDLMKTSIHAVRIKLL